MGVKLDQLQALLKKMAVDVLPDLEACLLPGLEEAANSLLPAADQAGAQAVESLFNPALQSALAAEIAKIQGAAPAAAPAAPAAP
jgi:hypothetical protein